MSQPSMPQRSRISSSQVKLNATICPLHRVSRFALAGLVSLAASANSPAQVSTRQASTPFTSEVERCIVPAAHFHRVNPFVLRAILVVESGLNPKAVGRNANGTSDVGIGQMNSMHFGTLAKHGISPENLKDACIGTYVAAWHLSKVMARFGNTWFGVAAYHSTTPYFNRRYQIMVSNELVRTGAMRGGLMSVPPLRPGGPPSQTQAQTASQNARARGDLTLTASVVADQ